MSTLTADDLWLKAKEELKKIIPGAFEEWFAQLMPVSVGAEGLVLEAPNPFSEIWINDNYLDVIRRAVQTVGKSSLDVVVRASHGNDAAPASPHAAAAAPEGVRTSRVRQPRGMRMGAVVRPQDNPAYALLNPRNTFDNFVLGGSNQMAAAVSVAVADNPGKAYNPLFVYGDTGLGKTHLMHAMAHACLQRAPETRIVYLSCEKFMNEFIEALKDQSLNKFREKYRKVDILLIDDIQFLAGKERIQEEFFHTFNDLFESGKQICLSSDRPAGDIDKLESRLVSRFQWGMITDIKAPDLETRVAILGKKAAAQNHDVPRHALEFIARRITRNIRRMEGALTRVAFLAKQGSDVSEAALEDLLSDLLQEENSMQLTIELIQKAVSDYFQVRMSDLVGPRRPADIAYARQVAMYLCRILTQKPLKEIGEAFGGRDHGTVIHACKTIENQMDVNPAEKQKIQYLQNRLATSGR